MADTIEVPARLFEKFLRASRTLEELQEELEELLITRNTALLRKLRKARRQHLSGKTRPFEEFERQLSHSRKRT